MDFLPDGLDEEEAPPLVAPPSEPAPVEAADAQPMAVDADSSNADAGTMFDDILPTSISEVASETKGSGATNGAAEDDDDDDDAFDKPEGEEAGNKGSDAATEGVSGVSGSSGPPMAPVTTNGDSAGAGGSVPVPMAEVNIPTADALPTKSYEELYGESKPQGWNLAFPPRAVIGGLSLLHTPVVEAKEASLKFTELLGPRTVGLDKTLSAGLAAAAKRKRKMKRVQRAGKEGTTLTAGKGFGESLLAQMEAEKLKAAGFSKVQSDDEDAFAPKPEGSSEEEGAARKKRSRNGVGAAFDFADDDEDLDANPLADNVPPVPLYPVGQSFAGPAAPAARSGEKKTETSGQEQAHPDDAASSQLEELVKYAPVQLVPWEQDILWEERGPEVPGVASPAPSTATGAGDGAVGGDDDEEEELLFEDAVAFGSGEQEGGTQGNGPSNSAKQSKKTSDGGTVRKEPTSWNPDAGILPTAPGVAVSDDWIEDIIWDHVPAGKDHSNDAVVLDLNDPFLLVTDHMLRSDGVEPPGGPPGDLPLRLRANPRGDEGRPDGPVTHPHILPDPIPKEQPPTPVQLSGIQHEPGDMETGVMTGEGAPKADAELVGGEVDLPEDDEAGQQMTLRTWIVKRPAKPADPPEDPFNLSNDRYYPKMEVQVKRKRAEKVEILHSLPALRLFNSREHLTKQELRDFHRPTMSWDVGRDNKFTIHAAPQMPAKQWKEMDAAPKTESELSARDDRVILLEYLEPRPAVMNLAGMGSKMFNYYRMKNSKDRNPEDVPKFVDGETWFLEPHDASPLVGSPEPGKVVQALVCNMFKTPVARRPPRRSDFLVVMPSGVNYEPGKLFIRKVDDTYVGGYTHPSTDVPAPNSRMATSYIKNRLAVYIYRVFKSAESEGYLSLRDVQLAFPSVRDTLLRRRLKEVAEFHRQGPDAGWWVLRENQQLPEEDEIQKLLSPEDVCLYEAMLAGEQRLMDSGIFDFRSITTESKDAGGEEDILTFGPKNVEEAELLMAPWNLTTNFLSAMAGRGMLFISGVGDKDGKGEGWSVLRVPSRAPPTKKPRKRTAEITGTEADLRKMKLEDARSQLRAFGVDEVTIRALSRWKLIGMIRELSTRAAQDGNNALNMWARTHKYTYAMKQAEWRDQRDKMFRQHLGELLANADDSEESDTDEEAEELLGDMADELEAAMGVAGDGPSTGDRMRYMAREQGGDAAMAALEERNMLEEMRKEAVEGAIAAGEAPREGEEGAGGAAAGAVGAANAVGGKKKIPVPSEGKRFVLRRTVTRTGEDGKETVEVEHIRDPRLIEGFLKKQAGAKKRMRQQKKSGGRKKQILTAAQEAEIVAQRKALARGLNSTRRKDPLFPPRGPDYENPSRLSGPAPTRGNTRPSRPPTKTSRARPSRAGGRASTPSARARGGRAARGGARGGKKAAPKRKRKRHEWEEDSDELPDIGDDEDSMSSLDDEDDEDSPVLSDDSGDDVDADEDDDFLADQIIPVKPKKKATSTKITLKRNTGPAPSSGKFKFTLSRGGSNAGLAPPPVPPPSTGAFKLSLKRPMKVEPGLGAMPPMVPPPVPMPAPAGQPHLLRLNTGGATSVSAAAPGGLKLKLSIGGGAKIAGGSTGAGALPSLHPPAPSPAGQTPAPVPVPVPMPAGVPMPAPVPTPAQLAYQQQQRQAALLREAQMRQLQAAQAAAAAYTPAAAPAAKASAPALSMNKIRIPMKKAPAPVPVAKAAAPSGARGGGIPAGVFYQDPLAAAAAAGATAVASPGSNKLKITKKKKIRMKREREEEEDWEAYSAKPKKTVRRARGAAGAYVELNKCFMQIWNKVTENQTWCWPFMKPVKDREAPGYSDVVKRPMDLGQMRSRIDGGTGYPSLAAFWADLELVENNCKAYNETRNPHLCMMAKLMLDAGRAKTAELKPKIDELEALAKE